MKITYTKKELKSFGKFCRDIKRDRTLEIINKICQEYYKYDNNNPVILDLRDKLKQKIQ